MIWEKLKQNNFGAKYKKPIITLAPMADVTDKPFRDIIYKYSHLGDKDITNNNIILWTEFVSADGLDSEGREHLEIDLKSDHKFITIAQVFSSSPEKIKKAVLFAKSLGYTSVDINMGCPVSVIGKQGAGASLIKTPELAKQIIDSACEVEDIEISVKTRIGYNNIEYKTWLPYIIQNPKLKALTIHLRTKKEMSQVPAHWEISREVNDFVRSINPNIFIIGNGDIRDLDDAYHKFDLSGFDGIMIGRGVFGKPWIFDNRDNINRDYTSYKQNIFKQHPVDKDINQKINIMLEHSKAFIDFFKIDHYGRGIKSFAIMKKHYKAYINGFVNAKELREKLFDCNNYQDLIKVIEDFKASKNINNFNDLNIDIDNKDNYNRFAKKSLWKRILKKIKNLL